MTGVISLSHPVPSADTDDLHVDSDSNDNSPIPKEKPLKQTKINMQQRPYRYTKSAQSASTDKDTAKDTHSHPSHSDSNKHSKHSNKSPNLPSFHGLRTCYPLSVYKKDYKNVLKEIICGIIVSFAQVPESMSFAMIGSLPAIFGLYSAWMIGGIMACFGARPAMISSATGGMGAILSPIILDPNLGINYLPYIIILSGILITICGLCGISKFARLIPQPVMFGFLNGLAIIILIAQFHLFEHAHGWQDYLIPALLAILSFFVVQFLPKLTVVIPSSLTAIVLAIAIEYLIIRMGLGLHTPLIGDMNDISGELPKPFWHNQHEYFTDLPSLSSTETWKKLIIPVILVTVVSVVEDCMTMDAVTDATHTKSKHLQRHTSQQQVVMGIANIIGGIFSTMGGHGAIGLSMVSCHSGSTGVYRISGIVAFILTFNIVMFGSALIDAIPYAALVGIMLAVVGHTFEWRSIPMVISSFLPRKLRRKLPSCMRERKIRRGDALVIVVVTVVVITINLAYAVVLGIVMQSLIYTWYSGFSFHVDKEYVRINIRKFSDFHMHYSRENSMEIIDPLDTHVHNEHHHNHHHHHHNEHHHNEHHHHDNEHGFTELHEIRDINHLDSHLEQQHMQSLDEDLIKEWENIKSINDTFKTDKSCETTDDKIKKKIPTFETYHIEHGTLRRSKSLSKLNLAEDEHHDHNGHHDKRNYKTLSDCTNPELEDFGSLIGFPAHATCNNRDDYILVYHFEGPLFFGNCRNLLDFFDPPNDPHHIEIHLRDACIYDFSAMNALNQVGAEYDNLGKTVHLRHINSTSHKLIAKANHLVKYFSYDDVIPKNKSKMNLFKNGSNDNSFTVTNNNEREISKSASLLQLGTPNQYRFRMNARHV